MIFAEEKQYTIRLGKSEIELKEYSNNYFDSIVCDPPYEIGFMNKAWDNTGIAFDVNFWKECLRVLKPGGYLLAFNHSRTFHRMMVAIEDAGFELRDTIMWLYGSGFPKSHNISKAIDKKGGNPLIVKEISEAIKEARESKNMSKSECDKIFCNSSTNWSWYEGRNGVARVPDIKTFNKICDMFPILIKYKDDIKELQTIIGSYERTENSGGMPLQGKREIMEVDITIPTSPQAKQWDGYGTALKPAFEPIVMARKPFKTTVAENVLKYGTGGINIDECRIGNEHFIQAASEYELSKGTFGDVKRNAKEYDGRFPSNMIHDGSEEAISGFPITSPSSKTIGINKKPHTSTNVNWSTSLKDSGIDDNGGSASRYFYCAKASVKDRDEGLEEFLSKFTASAEFRPNHMEKALEGESGNPYGRWQPKKNIHPTVKPTELMQYLVRLVTPKGGITLDPFMGSGSTGKAVMIENTERNANYKFVGIDLSKEYCEIGQVRIEWGINFRELEDTRILYTEEDKKQKVIQDKFNLFGDE